MIIKRHFLLVILLAGIFCLLNDSHVEAAKKYAHKSDYAVVYDAHNKKVATITTKKNIEYLSDLVGDLSGDEKGINRKAPEDAKISYWYELRQVKPKYKIKLYVYSNTKYVKIKNLPLIEHGTWKIKQSDFDKLNKPTSFD
ncbi:hypothetical protein JCM15457_1131 [Liquorilactobacillus sucicola DSM 21376 = JCM 15457]|uniref:Uncharacterized protein n=1 Tax=Liquorilactobacillus sucicola DSM 21376 = JCM 15457 TaxID=1423806 RepID=A0A023CWN6_9LACO|nr:hypothetical protein [Liquorilactobacillus sucicola]KRN06276.1 hypothetical protein FD15_GL001477 [Liquorilactobacillus sucicola DSM 21376 = JCM 15457]GAJ26214.1 hypothetical protein JCM15457_1131 [Liquorilactobacillus sucicola DSM 21376 = JCM 15457]